MVVSEFTAATITPTGIPAARCDALGLFEELLIHTADFHRSFSVLIHETVLIIIINQELSLLLHLLPASIQ